MSESAQETVRRIAASFDGEGILIFLFGTDGDCRIIDDFPLELLITVEVTGDRRWTQFYALEGGEHPGEMQRRNAAREWERSPLPTDSTGMTARADAWAH